MQREHTRANPFEDKAIRSETRRLGVSVSSPMAGVHACEEVAKKSLQPQAGVHEEEELAVKVHVKVL